MMQCKHGIVEINALRRRSFIMSGALALLLASQSSAQEQEEGMILRRQKRPGEDDNLFYFGQPGRVIPAGKATSVSVDGLQIVMHKPLYTYKAPLVVFSHGALGDPIMYRAIINHWVSHGFVVAAPVHDDSIFQNGLLARRSSLDSAAVWEYDKLLNDTEAWISRARACLRPLDVIDRLSDTIGVNLDIERPIIIGHEFGAFVAALLMGAKAMTSEEQVLSIPDNRWFAAGLFSPQGSGFMGLTDDSWEAVDRPLLVVQGALERDFTGQTPAQKIDPFWKSVPGNKHLAWFPHGDRLMFNGNPAAAAAQKRVDFENLLALTAVFLESYANYRPEIFQLLSSDWLERATSKAVQVAYR